MLIKIYIFKDVGTVKKILFQLPNFFFSTDIRSLNCISVPNLTEKYYSQIFV